MCLSYTTYHMYTHVRHENEMFPTTLWLAIFLSCQSLQRCSPRDTCTLLCLVLFYIVQRASEPGCTDHITLGLYA